MPAKDTQPMHISTWTIVRFFVVAVGLVLMYLISDTLIALLFAVIVASAIEPVIEWLKSYRVPRILAVVMIYFGIGLAFFFLFYLIVPLLLEEFHTLSVGYPSLQEQIRRGVNEAGALPFLPDFQLDPDALFSLPGQYVAKLGGGVISFVSAIFGGIFSFALVVVLSFYLAMQERGIEAFLRLVTPMRHEAYAIDLWERSQRKLGRWFRSQILLGVIVGILIFFGLTLLGVPNAFFFALVAAVFEIIPVAGPFLAAIPAVLVALITTPFLGLLTAGLYVAVQQIESHVIVPVVMRRALGLSPLIVVLALVIGGTLGGIFGILLAVPITVIGAELLDDWDKKKRALMPE